MSLRGCVLTFYFHSINNLNNKIVFSYYSIGVVWRTFNCLGIIKTMIEFLNNISQRWQISRWVNSTNINSFHIHVHFTKKRNNAGIPFLFLFIISIWSCHEVLKKIKDKGWYSHWSQPHHEWPLHSNGKVELPPGIESLGQHDLVTDPAHGGLLSDQFRTDHMRGCIWCFIRSVTNKIHGGHTSMLWNHQLGPLELLIGTCCRSHSYIKLEFLEKACSSRLLKSSWQ